MNNINIEEERIRATLILDKLSEIYPNTKCALYFNNIFELLIATVMSANTTDKQVNKVTPELFDIANNPYDMLNISYERICQVIKSCGNYHNKAKYILGISRILVDEYDGIVPADKGSLVKMPGVGDKTANVLLSIGYGIPAIAVDTHVGRVSMRLGLIDNDNNPSKATDILQGILPVDRWIDYHMLIINHGRICCKARAPLCTKCIISGLCNQFIEGK